MPVIHAAKALTPEGWKSDVRLTIDGEAIAAVETGVAPRAGDERHALAAPAIANLHSHAFQRGMAGLAEFRGATTDTFWTWRETMYRFALTMSPDDVEAVAAQLYVEMLEAGFAAVGEFHYLHHAPDGSPYAALAEMASRIVAAARRAGIGLTLLPVFYAHATFGGAPPNPEQRRFVNDIESFAKLLDDCRALMKDYPGGAVGVAPHSLRAVTPSELSALVGLARDAPIHIHAAEQVKEVEDCLLWSGARPVQWLLDHAPLDSRWCLVHATHMDAEETRRLARVGAVAGLCPVTEANLGDGVFNAPDFVAHGGLYGIGSIPTCSSASPPNCGSSNMRNGCAIARATSAPRRAPRPAARCSTRPRPAARGRWRAAAGVWRPARAPTSSRYAPTTLRSPGAATIRSSTRGSSASAIRSSIASGAADARSSSMVATPTVKRSRRDLPRRCAGYARDERVAAPGNLAMRSNARRAATPIRAKTERPDITLMTANRPPRPANSISLHQQILADIESRILSGEWPPGHRIPFEHELTARYKCSRMTVSKALTQLAGAGLIERRRKAGSFVTRPHSQSAVLEIQDVRAEIAALGLPYRYEIFRATSGARRAPTGRCSASRRATRCWR